MSWITETAVEQARALRAKEISAIELLEIYLKHYEALPEAINPLGVELFDRALVQAKKADALLAKGEGGKLCGVPITIKDSQWLSGYRCANGSLTLKDFVPTKTNEAIVQLEKEGAVTMGKTTCPELCLSGITSSEIYGLTSNPWDLERTPGGSSGGCGAAVASGFGNLSLGGDGGGSIRIPSAFCGIVGFKPTLNAVATAIGFKNWKSIVSYGPMTRTVADAKLMFEALNPNAERQKADVFEGLEAARLIVSEDMGFAPVNARIRSQFQTIVSMIEAQGASLVEDTPGMGSSVETWVVTATHDSWIYWKHILRKGHTVSKRARDFIAYGGMFSKKQFDNAQTHRQVIADAYKAMYERTGSRIMITPAMGCEAFMHGATHPDTIEDQEIQLPHLDWAGFMYDANLVGMPACVIPMGLGEQGLPISLQITGAPGDDWLVLEVAEAIEKLIGWDPKGVVDRYLTEPVEETQQPTIELA